MEVAFWLGCRIAEPDLDGLFHFLDWEVTGLPFLSGLQGPKLTWKLHVEQSQDGLADLVVRAGWHPEDLSVGLIVMNLGQPPQREASCCPSPGAFGAGYVKGP